MNQRPGIYNVMDYGLTGHDIGADTAAIQKAVDACTRNEACPELTIGNGLAGDAAHPGMPAQRLK